MLTNTDFFKQMLETEQDPEIRRMLTLFAGQPKDHFSQN